MNLDPITVILMTLLVWGTLLFFAYKYQVREQYGFVRVVVPSDRCGNSLCIR